MLKLILKLTVATTAVVGLVVWGLAAMFDFDLVAEGGMWPFIFCCAGIIVITVGLTALQFYSHSAGFDDKVDELDQRK